MKNSTINNSSTPTPRHFWHTLSTNASSEAVWRVWTTVSEWHTWDKGLKSAALQGAFVLNAEGSIVSQNGSTSRFRITTFEDGISYTFSTALPLATLHVKRTLSQRNQRQEFTHEVWFDGLLGGIFAQMLGKNFMAILPNVMQEVKVLAEADIHSRQIHQTQQ
jgi:Polyketide cyclase / dehydrase and lipid transport